MSVGRKQAFATVIVVLAGLALGSVIDRNMPSAEEIIERPFIRNASVNEPVNIRSAIVEVTSVQTAGQIVSYGIPYDTSGIWVVLDIEIEAEREPLVLTGMQLQSADGLIYGGTGDATASCETAQPGIPLTCQVAFEVSPDSLVDLKLQIPASGVENAPGDAMALVNLGITEQQTAADQSQDSISIVRTTYGASQ